MKLGVCVSEKKLKTEIRRSSEDQKVIQLMKIMVLQVPKQWWFGKLATYGIGGRPDRSLFGKSNSFYFFYRLKKKRDDPKVKRNVIRWNHETSNDERIKKTAVQRVLLTPSSPHCFLLLPLPPFFPPSSSSSSWRILWQNRVSTVFHFSLHKLPENIVRGKRETRPRPVLLPPWFVCPGGSQFFLTTVRKQKRNTSCFIGLCKRTRTVLPWLYVTVYGVFNSRREPRCFSQLVFSFQDVLQSLSGYLQDEFKVTNVAPLQVKMK